MSNLRQYIDKFGTDYPDRVWLIDPETSRTYTYADLKRHVEDFEQQLDACGLDHGTHIGFLANNGAWTTLVYLGVMASGRVIVPLNAVAGDVQLRHVLDHSDVAAVFVAPQYKDKLQALLKDVSRPVQVVSLDQNSGPAWSEFDSTGASSGYQKHGLPAADDPALLLYTSGSTGLPKGALLSHRAIVQGGKNVELGHNLTASDRALCVLPIYHINGAMVTVAAPLVSGGSVVMPARFSAKSFWNMIENHQCTWSSIVPTIIKYLLDRADQEPYQFGTDDRLARFRFARSASAPLAATVLMQWEDTFHVPMLETLGLTETAGTVAANPMPPRISKPGSVGLAFGNEIKVMNNDGAECPAGVVGEIVIRGDNVLTHYYKNPEATASAFTDDWFRTGDLGLLDEEGYLFITGRLKELIIRGGENIAPREIDDILYQHDAILEAAAVGVEDVNYGQEVVACVVRRDGYQCSEQELMDLCETAIGKYKSPKRIYFLDDLPKGPSGKILRLQLPKLIDSM